LTFNILALLSGQHHHFNQPPRQRTIYLFKSIIAHNYYSRLPAHTGKPFFVIASCPTQIIRRCFSNFPIQAHGTNYYFLHSTI